jgi:hypothetical protein
MRLWSNRLLPELANQCMRAATLITIMVYSRGTDKAVALPNRIRLNTNSSVGNSIAEAFVNVGLGELTGQDIQAAFPFYP